jgi:hypothetical protein
MEGLASTGFNRCNWVVAVAGWEGRQVAMKRMGSGSGGHIPNLLVCHYFSFLFLETDE